MKPATRALLEDAFLQILDNTVFRILAVVVALMVLPTFLVGATPEGLDLLFGWKTIPYSELGGIVGGARGADMQLAVVKGVQELAVQGIAGNIGVFFCIAATSFFVPRMLEKGAADVVFSRPMSRATLLLSRWFAGVLFVGVLAFLLVGGMHLGFLLRSGHSDPGFLWSALTLVYLFAMVHCFSTLMAVVTRSSVAAILLALVFFVFNGCIHRVWQFKEYGLAMAAEKAEDEGVDEPEGVVGTLVTVLDALHWTLPKTTDADILAGKLRTVVVGPDHVVRDAATELLVRAGYEGAELDRATTDLLAAPAVWSAKDANGDVAARIELKRRTRVVSREQRNGRERVKRQSQRQAAEEAQASSPSMRRETIPFGPGSVEIVGWSDSGVSGWVREKAFLAQGDWMYEVETAMRPDWIDEGERARRRRAFLDGLVFDDAAVGRVDPQTWYAKRFDWNAPAKFNAFVSIGSTLLFCALLMLAAVWRLSRIDF